jgi:hypothetical protein
VVGGGGVTILGDSPVISSPQGKNFFQGLDVGKSQK